MLAQSATFRAEMPSASCFDVAQRICDILKEV